MKTLKVCYLNNKQKRKNQITKVASNSINITSEIGKGTF